MASSHPECTSFSTAMRYVVHRRPFIQPNHGFEKQLQLYFECNYDLSHPRVLEYQRASKKATAVVEFHGKDSKRIRKAVTQSKISK